MAQDSMRNVVAAIREAGGDDLPGTVERSDSLVLRLGFDSMKIALLSLALEKELGVAIALDEWISSHPDPHELTVGSLCSYVDEVLRVDDSAVAS